MADYVMVSRKLIRTWLFSTMVLVLFVAGAYWYSYNNGRKICGIITLQDNTYKSNPPQTGTGMQLASELTKARHNYHC